jgi:hypothetical protein
LRITKKGGQQAFWLDEPARVKRSKKKEGFRSTTVRLPALFVRSSTLCLPIKALLFFISFNLNVMRSFIQY